MKQFLVEDGKSFVKATAEMKLPLAGLPLGRQVPNPEGEPVNIIALGYDEALNADDFLADLGTDAATLSATLARSPQLSKELGAVGGALIRRDTEEGIYREWVRLREGTARPAPVARPAAAPVAPYVPPVKPYIPPPAIHSCSYTCRGYESYSRPYSSVTPLHPSTAEARAAVYHICRGFQVVSVHCY